MILSTRRNHMLTSRRVVAGLAAALLSSGLAILSPVLTSSADAAELLVDGGFEAATGSPPVSPGWTVSDSVFDTPMCTGAWCSEAPPGVVAHTGTGFVWFGGTDTAGHTSRISQVLTIPPGSATLRYWFANPQVSDAGAPAVLNVTIDGKRVQTIAEFQFAETYAQLELDISEFADGGSHVLAFAYLNGELGDNSMTLDDISIDAVAGPPPVNADAGTLGAIPDAPVCDEFSAGLPRDVTFTVAGKVGKPTSVGVRIAFDPAHTFAGDVLAVLIAPDGRRTTIVGQIDNFHDTNNLVGPYLFTDAAPGSPSLEAASRESGDGAVPPGHYRASTHGHDLITPAFADLGNVNGTWTLRVRDLCKNDTGSVSAAALYVTTSGVPTDTDGDGVPDVTDDCPAKAGAKPDGCPDTTAPDTDFLSSPANGIATSLKVPFGFVSDETGVSYRCSLDGAVYQACANPTTLTVAPGAHTFRVAARDPSGNVDPYPATSTFTAYDCHSLNANVAQLTRALKRVKKAVKKTETRLEHAIEAGDRAKVKKLKAKLEKLDKKKATTVKKLAKATKSAAPCKVTSDSRR